MVFYIRITHEIKKHPLAVGNQRGERRPPRSAAAGGRLVLPAPDRRLSLLGSIWWAGAVAKHHAASSDRDTSNELLSEAIIWSVLVWFGGQRGGEKLGLRRP